MSDWTGTMSDELHWIITSILTFALVLCGAHIVMQHRTLEAVIHAQAVETNRAMAQSKEIARLTREVEALRHERFRRLQRVEKQIDLVVAASRSGWRKAERLLRDDEFRDGLD